MKKFLMRFALVLTAFVLIFALAACGDKGNSNDDEKQEGEKQEQTCSHNWQQEGYKPATCTEASNVDERCNLCGEQRTTHPQNALGHDMRETVSHSQAKPATCTEAGVKVYVCSRAGCNEITTEPIGATGHAYDTTLTSDGTKHFYLCANGCGINKEEATCNFVNGECSVCHGKEATKGLAFELVTDGAEQYYVCKGFQNADDKETVTELVVPGYYEGILVKEIGYEAFRYCYNLKKVTLNEGIQVLKEFAFNYCTSLVEINLCNSLTTIRQGALSGLHSLPSLTIPISVTKMEYGSISGNVGGNNLTGDPLVVYCSVASKPDGWPNGAIADNSTETVWNAKENALSESGNAYVEIGGLSYKLNVENKIAKVIYNATYFTALSGKIELGSVRYDGQDYKLTEIGKNAFKGTRICEVSLPNTLKVIGERAFEFCADLTVCDLNEGLEDIGEHAFYGTSLTEVSLPATLKKFGSAVYGYWYENDPHFLLNTTIRTLTIADGLAVRHEDTNNFKFKQSWDGYEGYELSYLSTAFRCCVGLETYVGPIEDNLELPIENLTTVTFTSGVRFGRENDYGFGFLDRYQRTTGSVLEKLTAVTFPDTLEILGKDGFIGCIALEEVTIPKSVTKVDSYAFHFERLDSSSTVGDRKQLKRLIVEEGIGGDVFEGASYLPWRTTYSGVVWIFESVTAPTDVLHAMPVCTKKLTVTPGTSKVIGENAYRMSQWSGTNDYYIYQNCYVFEELVVEEGVKEIGNAAFEMCYGLKTVSLPESLEKISAMAFSKTGITDLYLPENITNMGWYILEGTAATVHVNLTEAEVDEKIASGEWEGEWNDSGSGTVPVVYRDAAGVADNGCIYTVIDGVRYELKDGKATVTKQPSSVNQTRIVIPRSVIYNGTSYDVVEIEKWAFGNGRYPRVREVVIGDLVDGVYRTNVKTIPEEAFVDNDIIQTVIIGEGVTKIEAYAFQRCHLLENVSFPASLKTMERCAFQYCASLREIRLAPSSTLTMEYYAFYNCQGLERAYLMTRNVQITGDAFYGCFALTVYTVETSKPSYWATRATSTGEWNALSETVKREDGVVTYRYELAPVVWGYSYENDKQEAVGGYLVRTNTQSGGQNDFEFAYFTDDPAVYFVDSTGTRYRLNPTDKTATVTGPRVFVSPAYNGYGNLWYRCHLTVAKTVSYQGETYTVTGFDRTFVSGKSVVMGCATYKIYFTGTVEELAALSVYEDDYEQMNLYQIFKIRNDGDCIFYYAEEQETANADTAHNYWHYEDGKIVEW